MQDLDEQEKIKWPPVQYYNLSHNLTGDITYHRVYDTTWTTTEAIASQTYIVSVTPVNIFSKGIATGKFCECVCVYEIYNCLFVIELVVIVGISQCESNDDSNGSGGGCRFINQMTLTLTLVS